MSRFLPLALWCVPLAASALPGGCAPVEGDQITAKDVAAALPAFGRLAANTPLAPAPAPGAHRVLRSFELLALARRYALELTSADDLCFELPLESLDRARLLAAMQVAISLPETRIEILETSLYPVPRGRLDFRREDLGAPGLPGSSAPVMWRGNIVYGANQRFAIWARVRVTGHVSRVVAAESIAHGTVITPPQLRVETDHAFPVVSDFAAGIDQLAGRIATRNIAAGTEIRLSQIESPRDIRRGDTVDVEVRSGHTRVAFQGKSESDGRTGDTITVRNLRSNKIFQARVDGKDKAFVDAGAPRGN